LFEHIGNGIIRVNLSALETHDFSIDKLNELFVRSSTLVKGSEKAFMDKLDILSEEVRAGLFSFNEQALNSYLREYMKKGFPPVSHSQEYKQAYAPAYRVITEELMLLWYHRL